MKNNNITIYQILVRLFGNTNVKNRLSGTITENGVGKFDSISDKALQEIQDLGISHVWYTGVLAHASTANYAQYGIAKDYAEIIKGRAGSPYAVKDFYDVCPDLAKDVDKRMEEFERLIERTHSNKLKVIIDFVPNHVARNYRSNKKPDGEADLGENDNVEKGFDQKNDFYYLTDQAFKVPENIKPLGERTSSKQLFSYREVPAKASGNDCFRAQPDKDDWYETVKLNYGVNYFNNQVTHFDPPPPLWKKMKNILIYWLQKGIDGFRCDMAQMVPLAFWRWLIPQIKETYPEAIFIAETYQPSQYVSYVQEGKFDYLYDKVNLYDTLKEIIVHKHSASRITSCWQATEKVAANMLAFLENHDEQRVASAFFVKDPRPAFPAMVIAATLTKGATIIYFGQEVGEKGKRPHGFSRDDGKTSIFDYGNMTQFNKWVNSGKFNDELLSKKQKETRLFYRNLLHTAGNCPAISSGQLYDLQYFNVDNPHYPEHDVFSYFRYTSEQMFLVIVNFREHTKQIRLRIPQEVFELTGNQLKQNSSWKVVDLLYKKNYILEVTEPQKDGIPFRLARYESFIFSVITKEHL